MDPNMTMPLPSALTRHLQNRVKTGIILLLCGIFLALVGVTFTAMGWQPYRVSPAFDWPQMLGPVLISLGGTFVLTSVCRFGLVSCRFCRLCDLDVLEGPGMEETSSGPACPLSQRIMVHSSPVVCLPPPYSVVVAQDGQTQEYHTDRLTHIPFYSLNNLMFAAEEDRTGVWRSRTEKTQEEERRRDAVGEAPPAYEDIYPSEARTPD